MMNQEEIAKHIALLAHDGQFRRDGVTPYYTHPEAVAESFPKEAIEERAVAWLHDVLEDNPVFTSELLLKLGIKRNIVDAVEILTNRMQSRNVL